MRTMNPLASLACFFKSPFDPFAGIGIFDFKYSFLSLGQVEWTHGYKIVLPRKKLNGGDKLGAHQLRKSSLWLKSDAHKTLNQIKRAKVTDGSGVAQNACPQFRAGVASA